MTKTTIPKWVVPFGSESFGNLPNILTIVRLVIVPLFGWMLLAHPNEAGWRWATMLVFLIASLTDVADGYLARKYDLVSDFGKLWDPMADKALTGMAFVGLSILGELPWWITIVILVREWGITWLRFAIKKYAVMPASKGGKAKTVTQTIALVLFLLNLSLLPVFVAWSAWMFMTIAVALTVFTGIDYVAAAWSLRKSAKHNE